MLFCLPLQVISCRCLALTWTRSSYLCATMPRGRLERLLSKQVMHLLLILLTLNSYYNGSRTVNSMCTVYYIILHHSPAAWMIIIQHAPLYLRTLWHYTNAIIIINSCWIMVQYIKYTDVSLDWQKDVCNMKCVMTKITLMCHLDGLWCLTVLWHVLV